MKRLSLPLLAVLSLRAGGIEITLPSGAQELIKNHHLEPYSCSTYKELIDQHKADGADCLVARIVSRGKGYVSTQYVDAQALNRSLFQGELYPCRSESAKCLPFFFINALNNLPIIEDVYYFSLREDQGISWGTYLGSHMDLALENEQGKALRLLLDAQFEEDPDARAQAHYNLGVAYQRGAGVVQDFKKAMYWFEKSATNNRMLGAAALALGYLFAGGSGIKQDMGAAIAWYERAAEQTKNRQAATLGHLALGQLYKNQLKLDQAAIHYNQLLAMPDEQLKAQAELGLAEIYRIGTPTIPKNFAMAAELYKTGAQRSSNPRLQGMGLLGLAELYHHGGHGVEKNLSKAKQYYQAVMSNQLGADTHAIAAAGLGDIYRSGGQGIVADAHQAQQWYQKAIDSDHERSQRIAQLGLAELYRCGTGCKDSAKALDLYSRVAYCSDCSLRAQAYVGLGALYQERKEGENAVAWLKKAAEQSQASKTSVVAAMKLAGIYRRGCGGVACDGAQTIAWYIKVAQQKIDQAKSARAYEWLGHIYKEGKGNVPQDLAKAIDCYSHVALEAQDKKMQQRALIALKGLRKKSQALMAKTDAALQVQSLKVKR